VANPQAATLGKTGKFGDLWRRLWFLVGALVVYRIGAHIPVPGIDPVKLAELFQGQQGGILGVFNLFSGGALSRFTLFALGIMPYISSSIIMQLMTIAVPSIEQLKKEGEAGRRKITQYTRYGTVALALFQGLGIAIALESQAGLVLDPGMAFRFVTVLEITAVGRVARDNGFAVNLIMCPTRTKGVIVCDKPRSLDLDARPWRVVESCPADVLDEAIAIACQVIGVEI